MEQPSDAKAGKTPEAVEQSIANTKRRRERNAQRARSRKKGLKKAQLSYQLCNHTWSGPMGKKGEPGILDGAWRARAIVRFIEQDCPRCLKMRANYYRERTRSAEGELDKYRRRARVLLTEKVPAPAEMEVAPRHPSNVPRSPSNTTPSSDGWPGSKVRP